MATWVFKASSTHGSSDLDLSLAFGDTTQLTVVHTDGYESNNFVSLQSPIARERSFASWDGDGWTRIRVLLDLASLTAVAEVEPADGSTPPQFSPPVPLPPSAGAIVAVKVAAFHWNGDPMDFWIDDVDLGVDVPAT